MAGILVIAEAVDGALTPISGELIGAAKKLSGEGAGNVGAEVAGGAGDEDDGVCGHVGLRRWRVWRGL